MIGGPWAGRLGILFIMIIVVKASSSLAAFLVALAFVASTALLLYKGRYFPRVIMDILDRLTRTRLKIV